MSLLNWLSKIFPSFIKFKSTFSHSSQILCMSKLITTSYFFMRFCFRTAVFLSTFITYEFKPRNYCHTSLRTSCLVGRVIMFLPVCFVSPLILFIIHISILSELLFHLGRCFLDIYTITCFFIIGCDSLNKIHFIKSLWSPIFHTIQIWYFHVIFMSGVKILC